MSLTDLKDPNPILNFSVSPFSRVSPSPPPPQKSCTNSTANSKRCMLHPPVPRICALCLIMIPSSGMQLISRSVDRKGTSHKTNPRVSEGFGLVPNLSTSFQLLDMKVRIPLLQFLLLPLQLLLLLLLLLIIIIIHNLPKKTCYLVEPHFIQSLFPVLVNCSQGSYYYWYYSHVHVPQRFLIKVETITHLYKNIPPTTLLSERINIQSPTSHFCFSAGGDALLLSGRSLASLHDWPWLHDWPSGIGTCVYIIFQQPWVPVVNRCDPFPSVNPCELLTRKHCCLPVYTAGTWMALSKVNRQHVLWQSLSI